MDEQKVEAEAQSAPAEQPAQPDAKTEKKKLKKLEAQNAELHKQLEAAKAELDAANDKYLRMMAEYDNFRKRSAKEKEGIYDDACEDCFSVILPILDNLERAAGCDHAVMHIEDENLGESEIVEVFQRGYIRGDKIIRYAMVKVAN